MNTSNYSVPFLYALFLVIFAPTVLADHPHTAADALSLKVQPSAMTTLFDVDLQSKEQVLILSGRVKHRLHRHTSIGGHITVELLDDNGNSLGRQTTRVKERKTRSAHMRSGRFSIKIGNVPANLHSLKVTHSRG